MGDEGEEDERWSDWEDEEVSAVCLLCTFGAPASDVLAHMKQAHQLDLRASVRQQGALRWAWVLGGRGGLCGVSWDDGSCVQTPRQDWGKERR